MQSLKRFIFIKKSCDKLINKTENIYLIANNCLNIIKGHPYHIRLFSKNIIYNLKIFIINLIKLFLNLFQNEKTISKKKKNESLNLLLISNLINFKSLNRQDYIFGHLEKELKKKNINFHKILINHTIHSSSKLIKNLKKKKNIGIVDFKNQNFFINFKITVILFSFFLLYIFKGLINLSPINFIFALNFLNIDTKRNLNLLDNFKEYSKNFKYQNLLMPYEGYSWERLILMQSFLRKSKRIGYHFSALSKHQHSIFRTLDKKFQPDVIFTTGKYSKKKFKSNINIPIKILGSIRNFSKREKISHSSRKYDFCILPEGILSECKKLFLFSIKCANLHPNKKFIWRLHPSMNFQFVLKKLKISRSQLPKNIFLSKNDFYKDINNSKYCIYRGSTSVITAIQIGVYPIYFNNNEQINIDPIFDFKTWKTELNNYRDFEKFIIYSSNKINKKNQNKINAKKFGETYFQKINTKNLINEIKN